jgi:succinate dehydrogenase / fumarate reductase flavoprotein subunit
MPQERNLAYEYSNIKIEDELLPITPAAHYSMGGIKTDIDGKTNIKNLYACGECAQANIHGANRLGGNSLLEIVVFGKIAGINASNMAKEVSLNGSHSEQLIKDKNLINKIYNYPNKIDFYEKKELLGQLLFKNLGLFRSDSEMQNLLNTLNDLLNNIENMGIGDKSIKYNKNLVEFIEFRNMLKVSLLVTISAISRVESRGSHFRLDYPKQNENYEKNSLIINSKNAIEFESLI